MRHHNTNRKFGRKRDQRKALIRSLAKSLISKGKIETTEAKAKELRPFVEKLVTKARTGSVSTSRTLASRVDAKTLPSLLKLGEKYKDRNGGYTRIVKIWKKTGDGRKKAVIEFV